MLPWVIGFLIFNVFTIGASFYLSFTDYNLVQAPKWVGLIITRICSASAQASSTLVSSAAPDALAPRNREVLRIEVANGGFVFGAQEEGFWRALRLTIPFAFLSVPTGMFCAGGRAPAQPESAPARLLARALLPTRHSARWQPRCSGAGFFAPIPGCSTTSLCRSTTCSAGKRRAGSPTRTSRCLLLSSLACGGVRREFGHSAGGFKGHSEGIVRSCRHRRGRRVGEVPQRHHSHAQPRAVLQPRYQHYRRASGA